jgi:hypothetical protein
MTELSLGAIRALAVMKLVVEGIAVGHFVALFDCGGSNE